MGICDKENRDRLIDKLCYRQDGQKGNVMTRQVLKMAYNGTWTVKFDIEKNVNPYTVMYSWNELTAH